MSVDKYLRQEFVFSRATSLKYLFRRERYVALCSSVGWALARRLALAASWRRGVKSAGFHQYLCLKVSFLRGDERSKGVGDSCDD